MLILQEKSPIKSLKRMEELWALKYILPEVKLNEDTVGRLNRAKDNYDFWKGNMPDEKIQLWIIYLCCLIKDLEKNKVQRIFKKLIFKQKSLDNIYYIYTNLNRIINFISQKDEISPSNIYIKLKGLSNEILFLIMTESRDDIAKNRIVNFFKKYKKESVYTSGKELKKLHIEPGPIYSQILDRLLYAQLDGEVKNKEDEIIILKNILKERDKK